MTYGLMEGLDSPGSLSLLTVSPTSGLTVVSCLLAPVQDTRETLRSQPEATVLLTKYHHHS